MIICDVEGLGEFFSDRDWRDLVTRAWHAVRKRVTKCESTKFALGSAEYDSSFWYTMTLASVETHTTLMEELVVIDTQTLAFIPGQTVGIIIVFAGSAATELIRRHWLSCQVKLLASSLSLPEVLQRKPFMIRQCYSKVEGIVWKTL